MELQTNEEELKNRLSLIENMIAEGRREMESWGWAFLLWGVAYYLAIAWSAWGKSTWAWPATVTVALVITISLASRKSGKHPDTTIGRAIGAIWIALATSMFLLFLALGISSRLTDLHVFVAIASAMLGMANGASALVLRWRVQFACAVVWWMAAIASCFGSTAQSLIVFLIAIFLCQIVFGVYAMIVEAQRKRHSPIHA